MNRENKSNFNMKEEIGNIEGQEDTTKYGEFVSSYFAWMTLEEQKIRTKKMENMTKKSKQ
jgi:hypothetical protein